VNIPAATLDARRLEASSPISIPIQIRLSRDDVKTLRRLAAKLEQLLRDTPGSARVRNDWGEDIFTADLKISEDRAALDGISTAEVAAAATTASLWPACATAKSRLSSGCTGLRAGRLNPNDGQTQSELAKLCLRRDDTAGALTRLQKAAASMPLAPTVHYHLAPVVSADGTGREGRLSHPGFQAAQAGGGAGSGRLVVCETCSVPV